MGLIIAATLAIGFFGMIDEKVTQAILNDRRKIIERLKQEKENATINEFGLSLVTHLSEKQVRKTLCFLEKNNIVKRADPGKWIVNSTALSRV